MLNLVSGTILGNVKKISANSRYEITTPHGVAGIRGTDWMVSAIPTEDGKYMVTFSSVEGVVTVSAVINGQTIVRTLTSQTAWQIGQNVRPINPENLGNILQQFDNLNQSILFGINNGNPVGPGPTGTPPTHTSPFIGGPPQGDPSS